jgi:hypothetical protein
MATWRQIEAAERRQQREAQKRQRELERRGKEQAKQSAEEQARLEVETYDNRLEVLLSVHKEQGDIWDWASLAASLPPPAPNERFEQEQRAKQCLLVSSPQKRSWAEAAVAQARSADALTFQSSRNAYANEKALWEKMRSLARRVLAGEHKAYTEALVEFSPLAEISDLGSSINFTVHRAKLIEAALKVNGKEAIPSEAKTLTATGKVSVKPMAKGRFHELYQDYVCGCVLRVAREVLALLPVDTVLITAFVDAIDARTGQAVEQPVLSAAMSRANLSGLDFDRVDPSDLIEKFPHRGDFKTSRGTGEFVAIAPLIPADIPAERPQQVGINELLARSQELRGELTVRLAELAPAPTPPISLNTEPI